MAMFEFSAEENRKSEEAIKKRTVAAKEYYETVKDGERNVKKYVDTSDKAILDSVKSYQKLDNFIGKNASSLDDMNKKIRELHIKGALDVNAASKLNNELKEVAKQLINVRKVQKGSLFQRVPTEEVEKLNKMLGKASEHLHVAENTAVSFADRMAKIGPSFMKKWSAYNKAQKNSETSLQSYEGAFNRVGDNLGKMPGLMGKFGKAIKSVGAGLGGISKLIAGWPGAILMAAKALWNVGMSADQMVKDANKAFAEMRGPDIMTGDVIGQFKDFNKQIFNARENIQVGFGVEQIRELLGAMNQAGLNIQTLNKGLFSYRDAIYVAGKASKTLGLALPQVGSMISKLMTDFRMDMDSIDKAFVQVAFDAGKSGLATDRFWTTIENASASMALYGTFITAASKTMKAFTEDMVGGADDATEATEDMFAVFKSGNTSTQAALLDLAGQAGVSVSEMFREKAEEFGKRVVDIQSEISVIEAKSTKTPEDVTHLKKLRAELASTQSKQQRAMDAAGKRSVIQTAEMGMLAGEAPKLLQGVMKKIGNVSDLTQFSGKNMEKLLVEFKAMGVVGVKEKTVRMLIDHARNTKNSLNNLLNTSNKFFSDDIVAFKENKDEIAKAVRDASVPGEKQVENGQVLADLLMKQLGMDQTVADQWAEIAKTDVQSAERIAKLIESGDAKSIKGLDNILKSSDFINKYQITRFKSEEKTGKQLADATEDSFNQLVEGTLSYNEMVKMGKDELYWTMANWKVATVMNKTVADIYHFLNKGAKRLSMSQKVAQEQLKLSAETNKELSGLLKMDKDRNITDESQRAMVQEVAQNINELNKNLTIKKGVGKALGVASKSDKPLESLEKSFSKASEAGNKDLADTLRHEIEYFREKGDQDASEYIKSRLLGNENIVKELEEDKKVQDSTLKNLIELNGINKKIYDLEKLKLMSDEGFLDSISKQIHSEAGMDVKKIEETATRLNLSLSDVSKAYQKAGRGDAKFYKKLRGREIYQTGRSSISTKDFGGFGAAKESTTPAKTTPQGEIVGQGLQKPVRVTSPGSITLHQDEIILPRTFSEFKTVPTANEPRMVGPGGGGGTSKSIQINVSATEKDLATRIANEVRAVVNREYIGVV